MTNKINNYPTIQNNWTPIITKVQKVQVCEQILLLNLMLLYSSYMGGIGLKWRCLLFLSTLFFFDPHIQFRIQLVAT
jgi:hypothetical protein